MSRDREARRKHALGGLTSQCACALQAIQKLNDLYAKQKDAEALRRLLTELRPLFAVIPKAKTAKIVRTTIETIAKVPDSTQLQVRGLGSEPVQEHFMTWPGMRWLMWCLHASGRFRQTHDKTSSSSCQHPWCVQKMQPEIRLHEARWRRPICGDKCIGEAPCVHAHAQLAVCRGHADAGSLPLECPDRDDKPLTVSSVTISLM